ncbi:nicotinate-nucleotide adenylyltransferase [Acaryochloris sp. IP29b_bin.137]|uniref:nicotinate-nucleotide adenylyltransferase n=1 Tax=Acaryochloris sp. IP29b_bin.137 TaxID=2969217 RepID=UPI0026327F99|nr:nicotinate-nucleotide adenylyltransferase [Acaryochloris sp. IP29b_bin.137]
MKHIALFGTSADPPTVGHQSIIEWLAGLYDYVAVWTSDNPFKHHQSALAERQQMLALLVQDSQQRFKQVGLHTELSYAKTLMTVQHAQQIWPQAEFILVVGSDVVPTLSHWYGVETLFQQVKLLLLGRPDVQLQPSDLEEIERLGARFSIASFQGPPVSSSHYRHTGDINDVPPAIAAYIQHHHLYSWNEPKPPLDAPQPPLLLTTPTQL